jgi:hypothetical protein
MARDSDADGFDYEGQRGTRSTERIRWFFRLLGFERTPKED